MAGRRWILSAGILALGAVSVGASAQENAQIVEEIEVTARYLPPSPSEPVYASTIIGRSELDASGESRLDGVLQAVPGFGLFRRQPSRAAHPTTQGVTLRGLGPAAPVAHCSF